MRDIEELRPLRALTLLTIRQSLADTDEAQRGLLGNAEVLAQACFSQGQRVFPDARAVLEELTVGQMEALLEALSAADRPSVGGKTVNPAFDADRFAHLREGS